MAANSNPPTPSPPQRTFTLAHSTRPTHASFSVSTPILTSAALTWHRTPSLLAAYTGARRGELLNLRWRDVDFDSAEIRITGSVAFIAGERIEGTTKSGRSRTVSLDAETVRILRAHRAKQNAERLELGEAWRGGSESYVLTAWGEPIHPDTVSSLMSTLIQRHNAPKEGVQPEPLPHARLHDLRHVHATILLLAGVPVHVVAARLGHADPSITLSVYAHVVNEQLAEAADVFAKRVEEAG
jgi:integrase